MTRLWRLLRNVWHISFNPTPHQVRDTEMAQKITMKRGRFLISAMMINGGRPCKPFV
jgi:hypothetical protein